MSLCVGVCRRGWACVGVCVWMCIYLPVDGLQPKWSEAESHHWQCQLIICVSKYFQQIDSNGVFRVRGWGGWRIYLHFLVHRVWLRRAPEPLSCFCIARFVKMILKRESAVMSARLKPVCSQGMKKTQNTAFGFSCPPCPFSRTGTCKNCFSPSVRYLSCKPPTDYNKKSLQCGTNIKSLSEVIWCDRWLAMQIHLGLPLQMIFKHLKKIPHRELGVQTLTL